MARLKSRPFKNNDFSAAWEAVPLSKTTFSALFQRQLYFGAKAKGKGKSGSSAWRRRMTIRNKSKNKEDKDKSLRPSGFAAAFDAGLKPSSILEAKARAVLQRLKRIMCKTLAARLKRLRRSRV
jgi:hypothetical protein